MATRLLLSLLRGGHKGARIAQACRRETALFEILVQEKGWADFKTLADVFIQQVVKHELECQFPGIGSRVYGEENNEFTNKLGETITVEVKQNEEETCKLLSHVLDGNQNAARLLAECAHTSIDEASLDEASLKKLQDCELNVDELGIWIDPIDATSQYVKGIDNAIPNKHGIYNRGLECVTVLIGAYDILTGIPVMGVVFQPFYRKISNSVWEPRHLWGVVYNDFSLNNFESTFKMNQAKRHGDETFLVVGSGNDSSTRHLLADKSSLKLVLAAGAGYKCLCVVEGLADAFLYHDDSCYKWDTCATHALLRCVDGGMACLRDALQDKSIDLTKHEVKYNKASNSSWCNAGGILAYTSSEHSLACVDSLSKVLRC
ncbi:unnamed protein product [Clavelina lepadiformis]|uniref:Inositol polyphosphate 1-phosphatase n=1 Tax=Clavelina lepadiformis TaxID=159417 RepID=A0ABP0G1I7_CLALP